ncbi:MAG: hypothetical protein DRP67_05860 [Candidatus Omnitrophota bacterium]|nr:MAG: hypothetical protein DRP67_05860 [Candidatus Omnitrophota bacterium]
MDDKIKKMKILVIAKVFPSISETFILRRIVELIKRKNTVKILARYGDFSSLHQHIKKYNLLSHLHFYHIPRKIWRRILFQIMAEYKVISHSLKSFSKCINFFLHNPSDIISGRTFFYYTSLQKLSHLFPFDIANVHYGGNAQIALILKKLGIVRFIVVNFHGNDLRAGIRKREIYRKIINKVDLVIANSQYMKKELIKIGFPENKIIVYYPGIDLKEYQWRMPSIKNKKFYNYEWS